MSDVTGEWMNRGIRKQLSICAILTIFALVAHVVSTPSLYRTPTKAVLNIVEGLSLIWVIPIASAALRAFIAWHRGVFWTTLAKVGVVTSSLMVAITLYWSVSQAIAINVQPPAVTLSQPGPPAVDPYANVLNPQNWSKPEKR